MDQVAALTEALEFTRRTAAFFAKREMESGGGGDKPSIRMKNLASNAERLLEIVTKNAMIGDPADDTRH